MARITLLTSIRLLVNTISLKGEQAEKYRKLHKVNPFYLKNQLRVHFLKRLKVSFFTYELLYIIQTKYVIHIYIWG